MQKTFEEIEKVVQGPVVVTGHSLGAAHATLYVAMCTLANRPTMLRVVFGEPLSGFATLARLVLQTPSTSYCNHLSSLPFLHDPVTDIPLCIPPNELYVRATPLTYVHELPSADAILRMGPFAMHSIDAYVAALKPRSDVGIL